MNPNRRIDEDVSGISVQTPHVELFVGDDPAVIGQPNNPSGFGYAFTVANVQHILEVVGEECDRIFNAAPQELRDLIPPEDRRIGIYRHPNIGHARAQFCVQDANELQLKYNAETGEVTPIGYPPPKAGGILLNVKPDDDMENQKMYIGHEATHLVSMRSIHANDHPIMEALVAGVERDIYGERDGVSPDDDPKSIQHTSGFLSQSDFGSVSTGNCLPAVESMYLASHFASDLIKAEQVWKVWTILTKQTKETSFMPRRHHVFDALSQILDDDAAELFENPVFKTMQTGMNHVTLQNKDKTVALAHTFHAESNPHFGAISQAGVRQGIQLQTQAAKGQYAYFIQRTHGQPIVAGGNLDSKHLFTYDKLWNQFSKNAPPNLVQEVAATIAGMQVGIGQLDRMEIRKPPTPSSGKSIGIPAAQKEKAKREKKARKEKQKKKKQQRKKK